MRGARRTVLLGSALIVLNVAMVELAVRAFYAPQVGPRILLYGTPWRRNEIAAKPAVNKFADSPQTHDNKVGDYRGYQPGESAYSKYFPNEKKFTFSPDHARRYSVRINNHGFRGPDFADAKAPGTIRVLTLGASSTFGYHDADDQTYPYYMQKALEADASPGVRYEVINFAIPHATTDNILAMVLNEGFALEPDVVTFYEGANDSATIESRSGKTTEGLREWLAQHLLLAALADRLLPANAVADPEWWWSAELGERRSKAFLRNLTRLADECRRRGVRLVVATQQMKSDLVPHEQIRGVTYDDEVAIARAKLAHGEIGPGTSNVVQQTLDVRLTGAADAFAMRQMSMFTYPRILLIHSRLMADERAWAAANGVPLVDVIHVLDPRRDLLVNWVHLQADANAQIAQALAPVVRQEAAARPAG